MYMYRYMYVVCIYIYDMYVCTYVRTYVGMYVCIYIYIVNKARDLVISTQKKNVFFQFATFLRV